MIEWLWVEVPLWWMEHHTTVGLCSISAALGLRGGIAMEAWAERLRRERREYCEQLTAKESE